VISKAQQFLANVRGELEKTTWPTRKETYGSTVVVVVLVIAVGIYLGLVDWGLSRLVGFLLHS